MTHRAPESAAPPPEERSFAGMERFLLPSERRVLAVRRHWSRLAEPFLSALVGLVVLMWVDQVLPVAVPLVRDLLLAAWVGLMARLTWRVMEWRADWFVVTDRRLLLRTGLITRKVAMMPLIKVTDMSYSRPPVGRLLGYGEIVIESAGHDQALRRIRHLPRPDGLYLEICDLLFGPTAPVPGSAHWRH
jgi:membrane protein YdbS with pleckstrin-like domain